MKKSGIILLLIIMCVLATRLQAQNKEEARSLVKQGIALNDGGDYAGAIEKYKNALKADTGNLQADYEMGYTLYTSGKGKEAIPFLELILRSNDSKYETYELLGSIYDDEKQPEKAIELYKMGIQEKPDFERLHFNIGLTYLGLKKYKEAEEEAVAALKLNGSHASAQRLYGLAVWHQNKILGAVMAFCNFLMLEPQTARSAEVYGYLDQIFKGAAVQKNIYLETDKANGISPLSFAQSSVFLAAAAKAEFEKNNIGTPQERLNNELQMIFNAAGQQADKVKDKDFFWKFYADYFGKFSKSGNMPAFTRYISLSAYKDDNLAWFKENAKQLNDLDMYLRSTPRGF